jgi:hypothetical protein
MLAAIMEPFLYLMISNFRVITPPLLKLARRNLKVEGESEKPLSLQGRWKPRLLSVASLPKNHLGESLRGWN